MKQAIRCVASLSFGGYSRTYFFELDVPEALVPCFVLCSAGPLYIALGLGWCVH